MVWRRDWRRWQGRRLNSRGRFARTNGRSVRIAVFDHGDGRYSWRCLGTAVDVGVELRSVIWMVEPSGHLPNTPHQRHGPRCTLPAGQGSRRSARPLSGKPLDVRSFDPTEIGFTKPNHGFCTSKPRKMSMAETDNNRIRRIGVFVGIGLILGVALGAAFDNIAIGAVVGLILGAAYGSVFSRTK